MAALPYMQLYVADYLADAAHLTTIEHGAYLLLMFNYWQRGESFKAKDERTLNARLASVARVSNEQWESMRETLAEFFETSATEWAHRRIDADLSIVDAAQTQRAKAGKASAEVRRHQSRDQKKQELSKTKNARSTVVQRSMNERDTDTDTDTDTDKTKAEASPLGCAATTQPAQTPLVLIPEEPQAPPEQPKPFGERQPIVDAYNAVMPPKCVRAATPTELLLRRLAAAEKTAKRVCKSQGWKYDPGKFWPGYFDVCQQDPWMRGDIPNQNNPAWKQSLPVLLDDKRLGVVIDKAVEYMREEA